MKRKKLFSLFMTGIFIFGLCGTALASEPQYAENVVLKMKGGIKANLIPENAPVYIECDKYNPDHPGDWTLTWRDCYSNESIIKCYNLDPWIAAELKRTITSSNIGIHLHF